MLDQLTAIQTNTQAAIELAKNPQDIENLRIKTLGKKGELTLLLKNLGSLQPEERKEMGKKANEVRDVITSSLESARTNLEAIAQEQALIAEAVDITLPGRSKTLGHIHPITSFMWRLEDLFISLGFDVVEGNFIETVYNNFDALNTPQSHSSRDESDTFYIDETHLLRCHTSPAQVHIMETGKLPIRVISPGLCARYDDIDATHTPAFHQMEGLVIDKGINFGDFKGMMEIIVRYVFGPEAKTRLRPSHFPFTEPSVELDISCYACNVDKPRADCSVCKASGWVELWGCGMVHPKVLEMSGIDPTVYSGYAFGLGITRMTSAQFGIPVLKPYYENDMQFLGQF